MSNWLEICNLVLRGSKEPLKKTAKDPGMFLRLHFRSDRQTQRQMSCGPRPPPASAQQVVTNDLIVNLSWGAAFVEGEQRACLWWQEVETLLQQKAHQGTHMHGCMHAHLAAPSPPCKHTWLSLHMQFLILKRASSWRTAEVQNCVLGSFSGDTGSLFCLYNPVIFTHGQLLQKPSLVTIKRWMPGIVGFFPSPQSAASSWIKWRPMQGRPSQQATLTRFTRDGVNRSSVSFPQLSEPKKTKTLTLAYCKNS